MTGLTHGWCDARPASWILQPVVTVARWWIHDDEFDRAVVGNGFGRSRPIRGGEVGADLQIVAS